MENERSEYPLYIRNKDRALAFYEHFLEHPEYFSQDGQMPSDILRNITALRNSQDFPEDAEPGDPPVLMGQAGIVIPMDEAIRLCEEQGATFIQRIPAEKRHNLVFGEMCMMLDPGGNMFMIVER